MTRQSITVRKVYYVVAIISLMVLPACYTLFSHPRLASLNYQRPEDDRCITCHAASDLWRYVHPTGLPLTKTEWAAYYSDPWWFDERYHDAPDSVNTDETTSSSSEEGERR